MKISLPTEQRIRPYCEPHGIERKVIAGFWKDEAVQKRIASWMRTAVGIVESSHIRVMRIADNMRNVAVTEGDKVEAQIQFGWK